VSSHTLSNQDAALKDVFVPDRVAEMSYGDNPMYAMLDKMRGTMAGGRRYVQPIEFSNPGGASASYVDAMSNNTTSLYTDFLIDRKKQYQRVQVDHELLFATERKSDAFVRAIDEFDRGLRSLGEKIGRRCYRTMGGSLGKLSLASTTTTTLSFTDNAAVFNAHMGQVLQFAAADGTGSLRDSGDTVTVIGIDHEAGTLTIDVDLATKISGVQVGDYAFPKGDFGVCIAGLADWMPIDNRAARLAASYFSTTRSVSPVYLGGVTMDGTSFGGLDEVFIKLVGKVGKYNGKTSHIFANTESLTDLELLSNSKMKIMAEIEMQMKSETTGDVIVGFSGYRVMIGGRTVRVFPDRNCPSNVVHALQMDTWKLWHTGEMVNWLGEDYTGHKMQPSQNDDAAEARLGGYQNLGCKAPGWNGSSKINPSS
jgi:hypothetical protein